MIVAHEDPNSTNRASRRQVSLQQKKQDRKDVKKQMRLDPKYNPKKARSSKVSPQSKKNEQVASLIENPTVVQLKAAGTLTAEVQAGQDTTPDINNCQEEHTYIVNSNCNRHEKETTGKISNHQIEEISKMPGIQLDENKCASLETETNTDESASHGQRNLSAKLADEKTKVRQEELDAGAPAPPAAKDEQTVTDDSREQTSDYLSTNLIETKEKENVTGINQELAVLYQPTEKGDIFNSEKTLASKSTDHKHQVCDSYETDEKNLASSEKKIVPNKEQEVDILSLTPISKMKNEHLSEPKEEEELIVGLEEITMMILSENEEGDNSDGEKEDANKELHEIKEDQSINNNESEDKTETNLSNKDRTIQENIPTPSITTATTISDKLISPSTSTLSHKKKSNMISKLFIKYKEGKKSKKLLKSSPTTATTPTATTSNTVASNTTEKKKKIKAWKVWKKN